MGTVKNLTTKQVENIQIDEGVVYFGYGTAAERLLGPTRGGAEFGVTNTVRDIEFDGRRGKTKGLEVVEEQAAKLKITTLCCSQDDIKAAIPGSKAKTVEGNTVITNGDGGVIPGEDYADNVTMFARLLNGKFKKITIYNALHLGGFTIKASPKAEGEIALELDAHFDMTQGDGQQLYKIEDVDTMTPTQPAE